MFLLGQQHVCSQFGFFSEDNSFKKVPDNARRRKIDCGVQLERGAIVRGPDPPLVHNAHPKASGRVACAGLASNKNAPDSSSYETEQIKSTISLQQKISTFESRAMTPPTVFDSVQRGSPKQKDFLMPIYPFAGIV